MKPVIISTICIVFLISIWSFFYIHSGSTLKNICGELSESMSQNIQAEDWNSAEKSYIKAKNLWEKHKTLYYMLSGHGVIREADISFGRLKELIKCKAVPDALSEIGALQELFLSIRQGEAFSIDNIL